MTNFKIPKNGNSMMPFNFGPRETDPRNSGWYRDVSMLIIPYKTDAEILRKLMPEQFEISDEPTVSVNYTFEFLRGYGLLLIFILFLGLTVRFKLLSLLVSISTLSEIKFLNLDEFSTSKFLLLLTPEKVLFIC